jgi:hypothetical protein
MKNLYTKNEFLKIYNKQDEDMLNEGFFQFIGKMFNKAKSYINKIKGGNEVEAIYQKYIKIIEQEFKKKAQVDLHLGAEEQIKNQSPEQPKQQSNQPKQQPEQQSKQPEQQPKQQSKQQYKQSVPENSNVEFNDKINEAEQAVVQPTENKENQANVKMTGETLNKKRETLQNILKSYQAKALKEMQAILTKMGGPEKNPKLAIIIDNKKDQFNLDFLNAEIKSLEQGGDKITANKIATERNKLAKDLDARWNLEKVENVEIDVDGAKFKTGFPYRYKTAEGIKTIKISKKSDNPGEVVATYVSPEMGKTEPQNFKVANIEKDWKPVKDSEYNYYSKDNQKIIKVKTISEQDDKGLVEVQVGDNKFKVNAGALMDVNTKKPEAKQETIPETNTKPTNTKPTNPKQTNPKQTNQKQKIEVKPK